MALPAWTFSLSRSPRQVSNPSRAGNRLARSISVLQRQPEAASHSLRVTVALATTMPSPTWLATGQTRDRDGEFYPLPALKP